MARTAPCSAQTSAGRLSKAEQFLEAAETVAAFADDAADVGDAFATLLVHAGIAATDVLCCAKLGVHAVGQNHNEAAQLLAAVHKDLASDLRTLLGIKTKAAYSPRRVNSQDLARAFRAAQRLVKAARLSAS